MVIETKKRKNGSSFWIRWVLANTIAWSLIPLFILERGVIILMILFTALVIAFAQRIALPQIEVFENTRMRDTWIWVSTIVYAICLGVSTYLGSIRTDAFLSYLAFITTFSLAGVAQWLILRSALPEAGWWILASILGGFAGSQAAGFVLDIIGSELGTSMVFVWWMVFGCIYAAITGMSLVLMLKQEKIEMSSSERKSYM